MKRCGFNFLRPHVAVDVVASPSKGGRTLRNFSRDRKLPFVMKTVFYPLLPLPDFCNWPLATATTLPPPPRIPSTTTSPASG